jgi:membrane protease YdiL (CAAX protease family)
MNDRHSAEPSLIYCEIVMASSIRRFIRTHPLTSFLPLAFLLSWYPWLIALAMGRTTGPNPLGPFVAAIIVTAAGEGWPALKALFARIVKGKVGLRWYAMALVLPVALVGISFVGNSLFDAPLPTQSQLATWPDSIEKFVFILLFIALGEEPGWRGFLLPQLQRRYSPLLASLILGAIWALWHLPLLGTEIKPELIAPFVISVFAAAVVITRLYNGSGGSVLLPMLMHAMVNTVASGFAFQFVAGADLQRLWWLYAAVWVVTAAIVAAFMQRDQKRAIGATATPVAAPDIAALIAPSAHR